MSKVVGILVDGKPTWHAPGVVSDYDTLCGMDANDSVVGHEGSIEGKRGQKITCEECKTIYENFVALRLRAANFDQ